MFLQAKVEMLDNLLDIEVAYSLLRGGSDDSSKDPIDVNYEKLRTDIMVTGPALSEASKPFIPRAVVPKLECASASPGELVRTDCWGPRIDRPNRFPGVAACDTLRTSEHFTGKEAPCLRGRFQVAASTECKDLFLWGLKVLFLPLI